MRVATEGVEFDALLLAAGAGIRFGGGKLLAPWRGASVLDGALAAAFAAPARRVTVVWGADQRVPEAARVWALAHGQAGRLGLVEARAYTDGLSASLKAGLSALQPDCAGVFVFLGDMPRIPPSVLKPLAKAVAAGAPAAAPAFEGRRGHPVLLGRALFADLSGLEGDRGAGRLLDRLGAAVASVPAPDDGVLYDIDQPGDLADR